MSFLIWLCLVLIKIYICVEGAPKLGHIFFDPLVYEANLSKNKDSQKTTKSLENQYLRSNNNTKEINVTVKTTFNGYDFNETMCKQKNDRILCGYNKNKVNMENKELLEDLDNGCQIRGDRIECGYMNGPFTNPRRPPVHDDTKELLKFTRTTSKSTIFQKLITPTTVTMDTTTKKNISTTKIIQSTKQLSNKSMIYPPTTPIITLILKTNSTTALTKKLTTKYTQTTNTNKTIEGTKNCVEQDDHLFCIP